MAISISYGRHYPWNRPVGGAPQVNRPYAELELVGLKRSRRYWSLVDSGSDYTMLDVADAIACGIRLPNPNKSFRTATGQVIQGQLKRGVSLKIEGKSVPGDVLFLAGQTPILGRPTILSAFDIGFDLRGWLHT